MNPPDLDKIPNENAKEWCRDLLSNKYQQGFHKLITTDIETKKMSLCVLGVGCVTYQRLTKTKLKLDRDKLSKDAVVDGQCYRLSGRIQEFFGLLNNEGKHRRGGPSLVYLNDNNHWDFGRIVQYLCDNADDYFDMRVEDSVKKKNGKSVKKPKVE